MSLKNAAAALTLSLGTFGFAAQANSQENVMVVFDGSNSMWGQIEGVSKIEIARDTIGDLLGGWTEDRQVGLMAYGHRRRGDCGDIETLVEPQAGTTADIIERVQAISPRGKTPLTDAVEAAAKALSYEDTAATVVLISDGLESCDRDPCELAKALERGGVGFTAHVVGFGLGSDQDVGSLSCLAEETGGVFIEASNASELKTALSNVSQAVAKAPEPTPEPEPEVVPEPQTPEVIVYGPGSAVEGSEIKVIWEPTIGSADFINIVPVGTPEGEFGRRAQVGNNPDLDLVVPAGPGAYEIRYSANTGETYGVASLEVTQANVEVTAVPEAQAGAEFTVDWTPTIHPRDFVTIVPAGTPSDTIGTHMRADNPGERTLTAPGDPGAYEVRYVLHVDKKVVGLHAIEVTDSQVEVTAPDQVTSGAQFVAGWTPTINTRDFITIVAADAPEGEVGTHIRARDDTEGQLTAPSAPGIYEVRYVVEDGRRKVGSKTVEVVAAEVELTGPDQVLTGANFQFGWSPTINPRDYLTIVPAGAPGNTVEGHIRARTDSEGQLTAPADAGIYELRYVQEEGRNTVASLQIEVTDPEVTIDGPATALSGSKIPVTWTGAVNPRDLVTLVPVGTPNGEIATHIRVRTDDSGELQAPAETGLYEMRYVLEQGRKTMATAPIEIVDGEVTVTGPETVRRGEPFTVSWTGTISGRDYITIVPVGTPDGEYANYLQVRAFSDGELQAPSETGLYELRYVLREGAKTMARKPIEVLDADVTVSGPESIQTGATITVNWTGTVSPRDYVTIVPIGTPEGEYGNYVQTRGNTDGQFKAPAEPGLYELRYVLREGGKTLATQAIEVVQPSVSVSAPATAVIGSNFNVTWTGQVSEQDYITIVPKGTAEGEYGNYFVVRKHDGKELTAPSDTGVYEVRYVLQEGGKTLASTDIELVAADVSVSGPEEVRAQSSMTVSWTETINTGDYISVVPVGSPDDDFSQYFVVRDQNSKEIDTPDAPGLYELRYILKEGNKVLARQTIDVVDANAALSDGAQINAPDSAAAGSTVSISWSVEQETADQRLTLANPDQAIFTWITSQKMNGLTEVQVKMPDAPGLYELRILDVSGQAVLAQKMITVE
ncbi:MAG: vWA domain-containing protein [Pseudomonadota bacterium]